jgi:hypothetical protein
MMLALTPQIRSRRLVISISLLILVLSGASLVSAKQLVHEDGRLNQVHHFGGDALYCVDANTVATNSYPKMLDGGGFQLLSSSGQELWFVPAEDILAAIEESLDAEGGVLIAQGMGTHGPARLYTYFDGNVQHFVFSGYDEHGKPNMFDFTGCTPVGPIPQPEPEEELCTLIPYNVPAKRASTVKGLPVGQQIPCSDCPPIVVAFPKQREALGPGPLFGCLEDLYNNPI